ncbi:MAG TPA: TonB-dependent receptor [Steroidobacter sp.]|uniref:TonB-dependent receptor domain-containing protein n=1 Tax=Steroidobacter sp. TaxID=1978227 RepID=UPI002ED87E7B
MSEKTRDLLSATTKNLRAATVCMTGGLALISNCDALAQSTDATQSSASFAQEAAPTELVEIVVTGSRIARRDYVSASPITTVSEEFLQDSGEVAIEQAMNELPQFQRGQASTGSSNIAAGGRATLNLRGLGDSRNLVLLDGRRLPLASAFGVVDVNIISPGILQNIETITGGASAVYGSDAISGVVNFLPVRKLDGLKVDVQYGNSTKWDHALKDISLTGGSAFAEGRGNALVSLNYSSRETLYGYQRPRIYGAMTPSGFIGQGSYVAAGANQPSQDAVNDLFASYGTTGNVPSSSNFGFNDDGTLFSQNAGWNYQGPLGPTYGIVGGAVRYWGWLPASQVNGLERYSLFSNFDYELTPGVTLYTQILYADSSTFTDGAGARTQFGSALSPVLTVPVTNPFIPADLATLLASRPMPDEPFRFSGRYVGVPNDQWDEQYFTGQILSGVRGEFGFRDWTWDVYASVDRTQHVQTQLNAVLRDRVQRLLNAADGGLSLCAGGLNLFGLSNALSISPECRDFIQTSATNRERLSQQIVEASSQGTLFGLPAGDVQFALAASYRKNTYNFAPDANYAAGNIESVVGGQKSRGETKVQEYSGELRIPVLHELPLVNSLTFDVAYRYSDYEISGGVSTYKTDLEWSPIRSILVRGGYSRAIRAPNIGELFSSPTGGQVGFNNPPAAGEPCDSRGSARNGANAGQVSQLCVETGIPAAVIGNFQSQTVATASVSSGNLDLTPETADTYTAGIVFSSIAESAWLSKLSLSVDYFSIDIKDVIGPVNGLSALNKCYNLDGSNPTYSPSNVYCQLINRDASGQLVLIRTPYMNLGGRRTKGVDIALDWRLPASILGIQSDGEFFLNSNIGYMLSFEDALFPGDRFVDSAGTNGAQVDSRPKSKRFTTLGYRQGPAQVSLHWQYISAMRDRSILTNPASTVVGSPSYNKFDLSGRYRLNDGVDVRFSITNLLDEAPPFAASGQYTDGGVYDIIGRAFTLGVRITM